MLAKTERPQCPTVHCIQKESKVVDLTYKLSRSQSNQASMKCKRQINQIHGGFTLQPTALKEAAANVQMPDMTADTL